MLLAPHDDTCVVVRGGRFGSHVVVLCVERVPRDKLAKIPKPKPASFFEAGGMGRGADAVASSILDLHPCDELRVVCHFDATRPALRSSKRPMQQANASGQMASLLMGTHEIGELTGQKPPPVGQHVTLAEGGVDVLYGGIGALAKDQRYKLVHGTHTPWHLAFELEVPPAVIGGADVPMDIVLEEIFGTASELLLNNAPSLSVRHYLMPLRGYPAGKNFTSLQGDVQGGGAAVEHVLRSLHEACRAVVECGSTGGQEELESLGRSSLNGSVAWEI